LENPERDRILQHLSQSRELLLKAVEGLSPEQRAFRPTAESWSIADCVEHLTVVESNILKGIERMLQKPPAPNPETQGKDRMILENVPVRNIRVKGPDPVMPNGRWPDFAESLGQFEAARSRTISFAEATEADLRGWAFNHPFLGPLDCYQWLLFLATHCKRHVAQMAEVKSDSAFPGRVGSAIA
jgi:hypothetical protein